MDYFEGYVLAVCLMLVALGLWAVYSDWRRQRMVDARQREREWLAKAKWHRKQAADLEVKAEQSRLERSSGLYRGVPGSGSAGPEVQK